MYNNNKKLDPNSTEFLLCQILCQISMGIEGHAGLFSFLLSLEILNRLHL